VPFAEVSENLRRIVTDGCDADAACPKLFETTLQLDQLRAAERSPIGRAEEHQHRPARPHDRLEGANAASLIRQAEVRDSLTDLWTEFRDVNPCASCLSLEGKRRDKHPNRQDDGTTHKLLQQVRPSANGWIIAPFASA
jgi:hypothetical protein